MGCFDLKTQSNDVLSFFFRDVDQKSTGEVEKAKGENQEYQIIHNIT